MFKVECPGCKAPYQVDERRVPSSGLKMRCPKCGTSFKVDPPADPRRTGPSPVLGALGSDEPARPAGHKQTIVGAAPPPVQQKQTMQGVAAPPRPVVAKPPLPRARPEPRALTPIDDPYGEVDLPSVGDASEESDLPAPVSASRRAPGPGVQLPPARGPEEFGEIELDARRGPAQGGFGEIDLPAPVEQKALPPRRAVFGEIDLPSPVAERRDFGEIDLPAVGGPARAAQPARASGREIDLPAPRGELPSPAKQGSPDRPGTGGGFGEIDLPIAGAGLPSLSQSDLPAIGGAGLPVAGGAGLPTAARRADLPAPAAGLPVRAAGGGAGLPTPAPGGTAGLPASAPWGSSLPATTEGSDFPEAASELPAPGFDGDDEFDLPLGDGRPPPAFPRGATPAEADIFGGPEPSPHSPPPPLSPDGLSRQGGGGTNYGEVNLEGADGGPIHSDDDMEFGAIPQERSAEPAPVGPSPAASAPLPVPVQGLPQVQKRPRGRKVLRAVLALFVVAALGGGALALVPSVGPFGSYWITDRLNSGKYQGLLADAAKRSREHLSRDSFVDAKKALAVVESARADAKRVKGLSAYAAFVGYARDLRFGSEPEVRARAQVLLDEIAEAPGVPHLELAHAARAAVNGQLARARQQLQALAARDPRNIDVLVLRGEVELKARDPKAALEAWQAAAAVEPSARTAFGLARARHAGGDDAGAENEARRAVTLNPGHVGARILLSRIAWSSRAKEADAVKALEEVVKTPDKASSEEIVLAQTLLGDLHLARSRITHAETAYNEALKINPKAAHALRGLGDALYRAGRYSEALARFEAGVQADPDDLLAMVGVAKTKLALERLQDASALLKKLRQTHPKSFLVNYWYGQVLDAVGNRKDAEQAYRTAIKEGGKSPEVVDAYVALALLMNQQGRTDEAQKTLADAQTKLVDSPSIHKALGELALWQGRYEASVGEFRAALKLDPDDVGAKFRLGVALRRNRQFDEAAKTFDDVTAVDRDYPGLALERGLLHEAAGRTEEALKAYEAALAKAPNDPDLMLRVGCGKVAAGRAKQAEEQLRKVLGLRPNSAETNHCLGRALLVEGKNLAEALRMLERATDLDPNRAEYWLYVGWAANEAGRVAKADDSLRRALELDQGLADAYWQRGVLRARQGAVKDATSDLTKALELRPSRFEAHAALAEAYYDLGRESEAMSEWAKAIAAQSDNATWRFRYGKLLLANHRDDAARAELGKAIELAEPQDPKPRWLWEANHLMARAIGARPEAIKHWKAFLTLGPRDSAYREEAKLALRKLGQPWDGD